LFHSHIFLIIIFNSQQVSQPTIELKQTNQKSQFKPSIDYIDERDLDMNENEIHFENEKIPLLSSDDLTNFAQLWLHPTDDINTKLKYIFLSFFLFEKYLFLLINEKTLLI